MYRRRLIILVTAIALLAGACETDVPTPEEREAITPLVRTFLISLAKAYGDMDPRPLEGIAAPRFMEQAHHDIQLLQAGGVRLEPVLVNVTITDLKVIRHANAYVAATEVWDTRRFDSVTGEMVGQDAHSVLHSHIQFKKIDGDWLVLYREVEETATGPRLVVPSPTPNQ